MAHHQPVQQAMNGAGEIPDKLYFRIGEVARLCDVPTYVLRFWESEFPQLKPNKGGTGQRLYRRRDVEMARRIRSLLYDEGYTIPGARQLLRTEQRQREPQLTLAVETKPQPEVDQGRLREVRRELQDLLRLLAGPADSREGAAEQPASGYAESRGEVHPSFRRAAERFARRESSENLFTMPGEPRQEETE